jgi:hypothetical protein
MNDASEIVVGANGRVLVAPTTAEMPDDVSTDLSADWSEVGFVSENGVTFTDSKAITDIPAWQSFYPVRKIVSGKTSTIEFVMRQWNRTTVVFAFGGGAITNAAGVATYVPPAPGILDSRAVCVEWTDSGDTYRLVMPNGLASGDVSPNVVRTAATDLAVSFEATPEGNPVDDDLGSNPWYILTDAEGFASGS